MTREFNFASRYARKSDGDFVLAAGWAFWAAYWADRNEDKIGPGTEILDVAPDTPRWALQLGRKLARRLVEERGAPAHLDDQSCETVASTMLRRMAKPDRGDREPTDSNLGFYAAMQAMGHGVGLECCGLPHIDTPYMEAHP